VRRSVEAFLRENPVLGAASEDTRAKLAASAVVRRLHPRQILFQHGDPAEALYLVLQGRLSICLQTLDGRQLALNLVSAGSVLGEIAVLDGGLRSASAIALDDCTIAAVRRQDFLQAVSGDPALVESLFRKLCAELRRVSERVADAGFLDVQAGLAQRLLEQLPPGGREVALSQDELAQSLGVSRITANKYLNAWRREGWVALARSRITVLDSASLIRMIEDQVGGARLNAW
jgi:CRP-like cAMP-binding protein